MRFIKNKVLLSLASVVGILVIAYFCAPYYVQKALIHLYPDIDDLHIFNRNIVAAPDSARLWVHATDYNTYTLTPQEDSLLNRLETVSFLVIQHDSIVYEEYRGGWNDTLTSNLFSGTKSIVSLLTGIAIGEGKIKSIDDRVGDYLPAYREGRKGEVTIRNLLTMSAGLSWDESYSSLFSVTTQGYYGNNLYELAMNLEVIDEPGKQFSYRSGETQVLAFVVEAATGKTLSEYATEKLWAPLQAERDAYWLLDRKEGDEKAFCCFHTTARDAARFGRLLLHNGDWYGTQVVPLDYMQEATTPAYYLKDEWGKDSLDYYGFQIWQYKRVNPYFRGMLGQYIMAIPEKDAIFVRLGHKRADTYVRDVPQDLIDYYNLAANILDNRK